MFNKNDMTKMCDIHLFHVEANEQHVEVLVVINFQSLYVGDLESLTGGLGPAPSVVAPFS